MVRVGEQGHLLRQSQLFRMANIEAQLSKKSFKFTLV